MQKKLVERFRNDTGEVCEIQLHELGVAVGCYFNKCPSFQLMLGPLYRDAAAVAVKKKKEKKASEPREALGEKQSLNVVSACILALIHYNPHDSTDQGLR